MQSSHAHKVNLSDISVYEAEFATLDELVHMHSKLPSPDSVNRTGDRMWFVTMCNRPFDALMAGCKVQRKRYKFKLVTVVEDGKTAMRFVPQFKVLM
ncbi:TPA: hypothetical protein ACX6Q6_003533 [Photobacterium damselae]